jgi:hypothetical protein
MQSSSQGWMFKFTREASALENAVSIVPSLSISSLFAFNT